MDCVCDICGFEVPLLRRGQLGGAPSFERLRPVLFTGENTKPFSCHPSLILPQPCAIVHGLLLQITSLSSFVINFKMK